MSDFLMSDFFRRQLPVVLFAGWYDRSVSGMLFRRPGINHVRLYVNEANAIKCLMADLPMSDIPSTG